MHQPANEYTAFCAFEESTAIHALAEGLTLSLADGPHPLCLLAAQQLQLHLTDQQEWLHNFGLQTGAPGTVIGKMFGVLIVRTAEGRLGYLAAFSGKLANANHHAKFVPPIFDGMAEGGFLNAGMTRLSRINAAIGRLEANQDITRALRLKTLRKTFSLFLQNKIFDQYHFQNKAGVTKSLVQLFEQAGYKRPPAGAGECAAPKLLQYAFQQGMEPLALAEFWWGSSPKSATWKHGHFYTPCREKCGPLLVHMLN